MFDRARGRLQLVGSFKSRIVVTMNFTTLKLWKIKTHSAICFFASLVSVFSLLAMDQLIVFELKDHR